MPDAISLALRPHGVKNFVLVVSCFVWLGAEQNILLRHPLCQGAFSRRIPSWGPPPPSWGAAPPSSGRSRDRRVPSSGRLRGHRAPSGVAVAQPPWCGYVTAAPLQVWQLRDRRAPTDRRRNPQRISETPALNGRSRNPRK
jgi:hypothetical protein